MQEEKNMDQGYLKMEFDSCSQNEQFARIVTSAYCTRLDPTLEEMSDLKTAVSSSHQCSDSWIREWARKN